MEELKKKFEEIFKNLHIEHNQNYSINRINPKSLEIVTKLTLIQCLKEKYNAYNDAYSDFEDEYLRNRYFQLMMDIKEQINEIENDFINIYAKEYKN